jgi:hypothetical protein
MVSLSDTVVELYRTAGKQIRNLARQLESRSDIRIDSLGVS